MISKNAGKEGIVVQEIKTKDGAYGYNAATSAYGDMFEFGDPTKVVRHAPNAASVAGLMITTEALIAYEVYTLKAPAPGHGGGMLTTTSSRKSKRIKSPGEYSLWAFFMSRRKFLQRFDSFTGLCAVLRENNQATSAVRYL